MNRRHDGQSTSRWSTPHGDNRSYAGGGGTAGWRRASRIGAFLAALLIATGLPLGAGAAHAAAPRGSAARALDGRAASTTSATSAMTSTVTVGRQPDGSVVLPNDQIISPTGQQVEFPGRPNAVAVSPDGTTAAFLTAPASGVSPAAPITLIDLATGAVKQRFDPGDSSDSFAGILYSRDGRRLYASLDDGKILVADVAADGTLSLGALISLPQSNGSTPNPGGLALSADGKTLYVALNMSNTLGVVDLATQKLTAQIPVGNAPWGVVVDGATAYVTDEGGRVAATGDFTNTSAGTPIVADPNSGGAVTGAVSVVDLARGTTTRTIAVGLHPTALYLDGPNLFVANTDSDSVSVISPTIDQVVKTISIQPFPNAPFGSSPDALTMLPDGRLVVALGTNNALAVYNYQGAAQPVTFEGLLPTGWYPGSLALDTQRNRIVVANVKGVGSLATRASGDSPSTTRVGFNTHDYVGSASLIPYPSAADLAGGLTQVAHDNGWDKIDTTPGSPSAAPRAIPLRIGDPSTIKHVFYIIKENNTYDSFLGDDPRGNGDPNLTVFGKNVTPNQHALATQFPLLDNFYTSGVLSADGHQWTDQAMAPDYIEKMFDGFQRSYPYNGGDSLAYLPTGFIWQDAMRHGLGVRNYGEYANNFSGPPAQPYGSWTDWYRDSRILEGKLSGQLHAPLGTFKTTSDVPSNDKILNREFPPFDTTIPDQYRMDIFLSEFKQYVKDGNLPSLVMMELPNDHTSGTSPDYPTPRAQVADNDLALGRMVDAISHSPYWKDSAIFVVEDDSQNDVDHVDGHRMVGFVISPYAKRNFVDSTYYTHIDVVRTVEQILGLPPMNQFDLAATPMRDAFTDTPDVTPYTALSNNVPLNEMNPGSTTGPGGPAATPELGSGELLGGGLIALGLLYWRARRRSGKRADAAAGATLLVAFLLLTPALPLGHSASPTPVYSHAVAAANGNVAVASRPASTAALQAEWAAASQRMFGNRGRRIGPDGVNMQLLKRDIWYSVKGYTTPYPGDRTALTPQQVVAQDRYYWETLSYLNGRAAASAQHAQQ